jgi:Fur family ferric uptake transcriptional regulator
MTISPNVPRLRFDGLDGAVRALRNSGLRLSTSRRWCSWRCSRPRVPVSAEHIARALSLELTSVYRNLETLERHGLVRHVHLGHGPGLYTLVGESEREYLCCERCGAAQTLTPDQLDPVRDRVRELFGYGVRFTHFAIVGTCVECSPRETS